MKTAFIPVSLFLAASSVPAFASVYTLNNDEEFVVGDTINKIYEQLVEQGDSLDGKTVMLSSDIEEAELNLSGCYLGFNIQSDEERVQRKIMLSGGRFGLVGDFYSAAQSMAFSDIYLDGSEYTVTDSSPISLCGSLNLCRTKIANFNLESSCVFLGNTKESGWSELVVEDSDISGNHSSASFIGGGIVTLRGSNIFSNNEMISRNNRSLSAIGGNYVFVTGENIFTENRGYCISGVNIDLNGKNKFVGNAAAIDASGVVSIDGENVFYKHLQSAIDIRGETTGVCSLSIRGKNAFEENTSTGGGAIFFYSPWVNGILDVSGTNAFDENLAKADDVSKGNGGAIFAAEISLSGVNTFSKNIAGANFSGSLSKLESRGGGRGGAIYCSKILSISGDNCFSENSAAVTGGAIYADTLIVSGTNIFTGNTAKGYYGGAICAQDISISGENRFIKNIAKFRGGAIYCGIAAPILSLSGKNVFDANSAGNRGGAIYSNEIHAFGRNMFQNNIAKLGGAIYCCDGGNFSGESVFCGNLAYSSGGAIYACSTTGLTFSGENSKGVFKKNFANEVPNDIYLDGCPLTIRDHGVYDFQGGILAHSSRVSMMDGAQVFFRKGAINDFLYPMIIAGAETKVLFENSSNRFSNLTISDGARVSFSVNSEGCAKITGTLVNEGTLIFSKGNLELGESVKVFVNSAGTAIHASGTVLAFGGTYADGVFTAGATNIVVGGLGTSTELAAGTTLEITTDSSSVVLSTAAEGVVVNSAEALDAASVVIDTGTSGDETLAAWAFDIENGTGDNKSELLVVLNVGQYRDASTIKIFHKADDAGAEWEDYTDIVGNVIYDEVAGTVSFITSDFSSYAVTAASIPEPSSFGLLAGLGALALCVSRRRRNRR